MYSENATPKNGKKICNASTSFFFISEYHSTHQAEKSNVLDKEYILSS
jgi:hypothetical protein